MEDFRGFFKVVIIATACWLFGYCDGTVNESTWTDTNRLPRYCERIYSYQQTLADSVKLARDTTLKCPLPTPK